VSATPEPYAPTPEELDELRSFGTFVRDAVDSLLGRDVADAPRPLSSWTPEQRTLLEEIAKTPYELHLNAGDLSRILRSRGAFGMGGRDDDRYLARYVGLREPSALEAEVDDRPLWLWLRLHLMGRVSDEQWQAATRGLSASERFDLARRALGNAYQLMRRWPLPTITPAVEREDATTLQNVLIPCLDATSTGELEAELEREVGRSDVAVGQVVVLCLLLARRGVALPGQVTPHLTFALKLVTCIGTGRQLFALLSPERRLEILESLKLTWFNKGGWLYVDLLEPGDRARLVTEALASFDKPCRPEVARCVTELIRGLDPSLHDGLRAVAAGQGPNAKLITDALGS
jgi:hypothetical protein